MWKKPQSLVAFTNFELRTPELVEQVLGVEPPAEDGISENYLGFPVPTPRSAKITFSPTLSISFRAFLQFGIC